MVSLLMDTALFQILPLPRAASLRHWCEANDASLFLSAASLTEIAGAIHKMPSSPSERAKALLKWLDEVASGFGDRIHPIDTEVSLRAGAMLARLTNSPARLKLHDAQLVATAEVHGHGLLTRRVSTFGPWTRVPIETV
jgi:predicted nucleic acid-binding protein